MPSRVSFSWPPPTSASRAAARIASSVALRGRSLRAAAALTPHPAYHARERSSRKRRRSRRRSQERLQGGGDPVARELGIDHLVHPTTAGGNGYIELVDLVGALELAPVGAGGHRAA